MSPPVLNASTNSRRDGTKPVPYEAPLEPTAGFGDRRRRAHTGFWGRGHVALARAAWRVRAQAHFPSTCAPIGAYEGESSRGSRTAQATLRSVEDRRLEYECLRHPISRDGLPNETKLPDSRHTPISSHRRRVRCLTLAGCRWTRHGTRPPGGPSRTHRRRPGAGRGCARGGGAETHCPPTRSAPNDGTRAGACIVFNATCLSRLRC